jgi:pSer/pThr/pTyr-binding forkhead associated (FHA) protein
MDVTLQMMWGSLLGKKIRVPVGQSVKVGRSSQCDIPIVYDHRMSRTHFSLDWEGTTCWIYDLNSRNGTFLNGRKVQKAPLGDGDAIQAGSTILVVRRHRDDWDEPVGICEEWRPITDPNGFANFEPIMADAERPDVAARARQRH